MPISNSRKYTESKTLSNDNKFEIYYLIVYYLGVSDHVLHIVEINNVMVIKEAFKIIYRVSILIYCARTL